MAKKGSRLREFEKNNRTLDISSKQKARKEKKREKLKLVQAEAAAGTSAESNGSGKKHRINWLRMGSVLVALVFIAVVVFSIKNIYDLKEREASLMEENLRLQMIKEELEMQAANIDSDAYIEEKARRDLKLVKGNELIFYFPEGFQLEEKNDTTEEEENE